MPLIAALVTPQLFMERVEVTPTYLVHRREPPHTRSNADVAFGDIASAVELRYDNGNTGLELVLRDGRTVKLPANTVLTAARDTIRDQLRSRNIPVSIYTIRREQG